MTRPGPDIDALAKVLFDRGLLAEEDWVEVLSAARAEDAHPQTVVVAKGFCTEPDILTALGETLGMPFVADLSTLTPSELFVRSVPRDFARRHRVMGFEGPNGEILVATSRPLSLHAVDDISCRTGAEIHTVTACDSDVLNVVNSAYEGNQGELANVLDDIGNLNLEGLSRQIEQSEDLMDMATQAPIVKLLNTILTTALPLRATDIHLQPFENHLRVRYRIDGILYTKMEIPKEIQDAVLSRVKIMSKLDIAERRLPQDGAMSFTSAGREVDVRISSVPTQHGERLVMRLQDKSSGLYHMEKIGLAPDHLAAFRSLLRLSHGIILVTGPTGSGKTTTLYSALKHINSPDLNIITIEDPVEYLLPGVSQIQVSSKRGLNFSKGLRSIVRQDPDVLMVGEIRDYETLAIAIQSALTGHLVFSTLHTNDAAGAVSRMLDLGAEPYLVNSSLSAVLAQRLVRLICPHCRETHELTPVEASDLRISPDDVAGRTLYRGRGCDACADTGCLGRTGVYEILVVDDEVREQIAQRESAAAIKKKAVERGMRTLREDALDKMFAGLTSPQDVIRVTQLDAL
jgi:general secretion pathway protein E